ncbi:hypothetical protein [Aureibacter tunicatorum]|uniref:ParB/Sulfiredoxin domain-containing protein n=1 Tax=Aureibacter tunicatorum TaxID=866807 RepID=A0AAE3XUB7_9BACT|nr:hypothetical protein [Aureibacter tunicatorum]MDR6241849.1 hypothetical protein [Aureibacter tunicatorum]BDD07096.1 hypothetical protein AUTU_45790 [Aureibacter tunicatorum]
MALKFNKNKAKATQTGNFANAVGISDGRRFNSKTINFVILPELQDLLPRLTVSEKKKLEQNLLKQGIIDPLVIWQRKDESPVLLDGHNRFSIASEHNLDFPIKTLEFDSIDDVKNYMLDLQMGKRNLIKWQVSYFRGMKYARMKNTAGGEREGAGRKKDGNISNELVSSNTGIDLLDQYASEFGIGRATLNRDYNFYLGVEALPEDYANRFKERRIKIPKQSIEQLGKINSKEDLDKEQVDKFLGHFVSLDEENKIDGDDVWLQSIKQTTINQSKYKPVKLSSFMNSEQKRVNQFIEHESKESLKKIKQVYLSLIAEIESHL